MHHFQIKLSNLCSKISRKDKFKLVFTLFKIKNNFLCKDFISYNLKSFLVYKFTCARYSSSNIGKTYRHIKTWIEKHIQKKNNFHIFKYLHSSKRYLDSHILHHKPQHTRTVYIWQVSVKFFKRNIHYHHSKNNLKIQVSLKMAFMSPFCNSQGCYCSNTQDKTSHALTTKITIIFS